MATTGTIKPIIKKIPPKNSNMDDVYVTLIGIPSA
jgi:hypothetical protein